MERAIKSNEILPSADIRPLNDAEIDYVNGGVSVGGALVRLAEIIYHKMLAP